MCVHLEWDNREKTVIRWDFGGGIGLVNFIIPINETAQRAILSDADSVDAILNIGWRFPFPNRPFRYIAQAILAAPASLDHIVIAAYPLARLIAAGALARRESRGVHMRTDFPHQDAALDGMHFVCGADGQVAGERWA